MRIASLVRFVLRLALYLVLIASVSFDGIVSPSISVVLAGNDENPWFESSSVAESYDGSPPNTFLRSDTDRLEIDNDPTAIGEDLVVHLRDFQPNVVVLLRTYRCRQNDCPTDCCWEWRFEDRIRVDRFGRADWPIGTNSWPATMYRFCTTDYIRCRSKFITHTVKPAPEYVPPAPEYVPPAPVYVPPAPPTPAPTADPAGRTAPVAGKCPQTHQLKGTTAASGERIYYEPDRDEYPSVTPEVCFTAGGDARAAGYRSSKP